MLTQININKLLFFDIETVSEFKDYNELSESKKELWQRKHVFIEKTHDDYSKSYPLRAGVYAEFAKVVCISCGFFIHDEFRIKSFANTNEEIVLQDFAQMLNENTFLLCGHNIKEFDVPFICRRMLVHGIPLPPCIDIAGRKPWEVDFVDSLHLWKFGDYKHYTSLNLLTELFDIPTPKDDINGSEVGRVFWEENDLERIVEYCQKDVVSVARLIQRWKGCEILKDKEVRVIR